MFPGAPPRSPATAQRRHHLRRFLYIVRPFLTLPSSPGAFLTGSHHQLLAVIGRRCTAVGAVVLGRRR
ncbi:hypothetical protein Droror1_Dr00028274, partial [Drosera rotundifolia]